MSARALASGTEVLWYTVREVLGQGGFGITYLAHDKNLDRDVAIKEYLPTAFAFRHQDHTVKPMTSEHGDNFAWGLDSFLKEAKTLARFNHENIVGVHSVFEENNTAYMVMEYEQGDSLFTLFKGGANIDQQFLERIFFPIFDGLERIHALGFIHRDIKPANIYVRLNKTPVLIDFGSARQTSQQHTGEMTTLVSQGYTPLEQYSPNYGDQGPWTDIYSLAATLYQGVTGEKPDESLGRSACRLRGQPDSLARLSTHDYPAYEQSFLDAILAGLALEPEMRPQSLTQWKQQFVSAASESADWTKVSMISDEADKTRIQPRPEPQPSNTDWTDAPIALTHRESGADFANVGTVQDAEIDLGSKHKTKAGKGKKLSTVAILLLACVGAAIGIYQFLPNTITSGTRIDTAFLGSLPKPDNAVSVSLPKNRIMLQLDEMQALATLYAQALPLEPNHPELNSGVTALGATLISTARQWNSDSHSAISEKLLRVSKTLPESVHSHERVASVVNASEQLSNEQLVLDLLDSGQYLQPAGNSVLDKINSLTVTDANKVRSSASWARMIEKLKTATIDSIQDRDFQQAALQVEAALALDPDNTQFQMLSSHLLSRK